MLKPTSLSVKYGNLCTDILFTYMPKSTNYGEGLIDTIKKIREFFNILHRISLFYIIYELLSWLFDFFMQIELSSK